MAFVELYRDDFATDKLASDYVFDAGSGTLAVSGGVLTPTSTALKELYNSRAGQRIDQRSTFKFTTGSAGSPQFVALMLKRTGAQTYLFAQESGAGVRLFKSVSGTTTALAAAVTHTTLANSTSYWLRAYIQGNVFTGELWTTDPDLGGSPLTTSTFTLSGADATAFGSGVQGYSGLRLAPATTAGWSYDDFRVSAPGFADTPTGSIVLSGSRTEAKQYVEAPAGQVGLTGARTEAVTRTDTPSGSIPLLGASVDAKVGTDLPAGTLSLGGQMSDALTHAAITYGQVAAQGTIAEQLVRSSILGGGLVLSGSAVELIRRASSPTGTVPIVGVNLEGGTMVRIRLGARLASFPHVARVHASRPDTRVAAAPLALAVDGGDSTRTVVADG